MRIFFGSFFKIPIYPFLSVFIRGIILPCYKIFNYLLFFNVFIAGKVENLEYFTFSRLTENDFTEIIRNAGGERYTNDLSVENLNTDYKLDDCVIELKIIEEEPIEKKSKQENLAKLFRTDIKTVILNPLDLNYEDKRKYYNILATPIKNALKKASKQLQESSKEINAKCKIAILLNNGLTMTTPDEFEQIAIDRAKNDTSGIDILIICGVYHYCDSFDTIVIAPFKDQKINDKDRSQIVKKIRNAWDNKLDEYMTRQIRDESINRDKNPVLDLYFDIGPIRYVKPPMQWANESKFWGKNGRPREDSTGMERCPPVGIILPKFDSSSYEYAKENIINDQMLHDSLDNYLLWIENEKVANEDIFKPIVPILVKSGDLRSLGSSFKFSDITNLALSKYQTLIVDVMDKSIEFHENPVSLNYILLQINEIGIDRANDIGFISHNFGDILSDNQDFLIKGERMKFEYGLALASSYCLSLEADIVYFYKNEDFKWK
jgi:hypothetical protein